MGKNKNKDCLYMVAYRVNRNSNEYSYKQIIKYYNSMMIHEFVYQGKIICC